MAFLGTWQQTQNGKVIQPAFTAKDKDVIVLGKNQL